MMKKLILAVLVFSSVSCAASRAPKSLTGIGVTAWQANEVVIALDAVMNSAIALNELTACDPTCHPVLSEQNTRIVVQAIRGADVTIKQFPAGWNIVAATALDQVSTYIDDNGKAKLQPYLTAASAILKSLGGR